MDSKRPLENIASIQYANGVLTTLGEISALLWKLKVLYGQEVATRAVQALYETWKNTTTPDLMGGESFDSLLNSFEVEKPKDL